MSIKKFNPPTKYPHFIHGGDYNPDQWKDMPQILEDDMRLMAEANCNTMSLGIFSWSELEPEEGKYDFSFMDKMMDMLAENGKKVILATPSGARPAWMSHAHPEVLRVREDGGRNKHGQRHNHCLTSKYYREKVRAINTELAKRYKDHPALLMWHISNEFGGFCYCEECQSAFRGWLKNKYATLENLNKAWWTAFWSHTYTAWEQIEAPSDIGENCTDGLTLDWKRFTTYQTGDFIDNEAAPLREYTPDIPITINMMEPIFTLDYRELKKHVDVISWDNYPEWHMGDDVYTAAMTGFNHDIFRCLKQKPFMLMESAPSLVNWKSYNKLKKPGVNKLSSLQAVAHGSDSVQYFQWRKGRGCSEKHHGAVVSHVGTSDTREFREVAELGGMLKQLDEILGTVTESEVAVFYDWDNYWALDNASGYHKEDKKFLETVVKHYAAFWRRGINVDVVGASDDLSKYKIVVAPMLYMVKEDQAKNMEQFVKNGGTVVATYMLGTVEENSLCWLGGMPGGDLRKVFGVLTEEIDTLMPEEKNRVKLGCGREYEAIDYCEIIHAESAETMGEFEYDFYKGSPALTKNKYGKGEAYYIAFRDNGEFVNDFYEKLANDKGIKRNIESELPHGVTAQSRTDGENEYIFIQNYTPETVTVNVGAGVIIPENEEINGELVLDGYGIKILKR